MLLELNPKASCLAIGYRMSYSGEPLERVPPQVANLAAREKELALVVYSHGAMTAKALEAQLSRPPSNSALRSMLNRLCRKGVLKRRRLTPSKHKIAKRIPYLYFPAVTADEVRKGAVRQIARDYFDDSLSLVAQTTIELLEADVSAESASRQLSGRRHPSQVGIAA